MERKSQESNYSVELDTDRHYSCSPFLLRHHNGLDDQTSHIHSHLHSHPYLHTKEFFLKDESDKISTNQSTPTEELCDKIESPKITDNLIITIETPLSPCYSWSENETCCKHKGNIFCCEEFENRIFSWVDINVPKMADPEDKMRIFFEAKRQLIRSVSLQIKKDCSTSIKKEIEENKNDNLDNNLTSELSQCSLFSSLLEANILQFTPSPKELSISNRMVPFQSILQKDQSIQSITPISLPDKSKSNLLKRRQSQIIISSAKDITQKNTLSIPIRLAISEETD